jgi:hypothetical protein
MFKQNDKCLSKICFSNKCLSKIYLSDKCLSKPPAGIISNALRVGQQNGLSNLEGRHVPKSIQLYGIIREYEMTATCCCDMPVFLKFAIEQSLSPFSQIWCTQSLSGIHWSSLVWSQTTSKNVFMAFCLEPIFLISRKMYLNSVWQML